MILIAYATDPADQASVAKFNELQSQFFQRADLHNVGIDPDAPDAAAQLQKLKLRQDSVLKALITCLSTRTFPLRHTAIKARTLRKSRH